MPLRETWRRYIPLDLAGGMNTREDPSRLGGKAFVMLRNIRRTEATLRQRAGWQKINLTGVSGVTRWIGGFSYAKRDGTIIELVVGDNSKVYRTNTDPPTALDMEFDTWSWGVHDRASFAQCGDDCFIFVGRTDGPGLNLRYDGTANKVFSMGMADPSLPGLGGGGSGAVPDCTRYYRVLFKDVDKGYYSAGPSSVITFTGGGNNHKTAIFNVYTYSGTGRTIHRVIQVSADSSVWKTLTTLSDNTTVGTAEAPAAYDNTTDLTTLANSDIVLGDVWPVCKFGIAFPSGLVYAGYDVTNGLPNRLIYSYDVDVPEIQGGYVDVGDRGEAITGICLWNDGVLVSKEHSLWHVPRRSPVARIVCEDVGGAAHQALLPMEGGVAFPATDGIRFFNGQQAPFVGKDPYGPQSGSRVFELKRTWDSVAQAALDKCFAARFRAEGIAIWFVQTDATAVFSQWGIVWDYRKNEMYLDDAYVQCVWEAHVAGSKELRIHAGMPMGFIGRLAYGVGDGAGLTDFTKGGVVSDGGTTVLTDRVDLPVAGSGLRGVLLHVFKGTGAMGDPATAYGLGQFISSNTGSQFYLATPLATAMAADSKWALGRPPIDIDLDGIRALDPGVAFLVREAELHLLPSTKP